MEDLVDLTLLPDSNMKEGEGPFPAIMRVQSAELGYCVWKSSCIDRRAELIEERKCFLTYREFQISLAGTKDPSKLSRYLIVSRAKKLIRWAT